MTAEQIETVKSLLPTELGSSEAMAVIAADILRQSVWSARMESARYLAQVREVCAAVAGGEYNLADARMRLTRTLAEMGHDVAGAAGIQNPASRRRLDLIIKTRTQMAASAAEVNAQNQYTVWSRPAWELKRYGQRRVPRDWPMRWKAAGDSVGWVGVSRDFGALIALKDSPIWQALGDGAGGYRDTLGNPFPPFAFSSGMAWRGVRREKCIQLGLIGENEQPGVPAKVKVGPTSEELAESVHRFGTGVARGLE